MHRCPDYQQVVAVCDRVALSKLVHTRACIDCDSLIVDADSLVSV